MHKSLYGHNSSIRSIPVLSRAVSAKAQSKLASRLGETIVACSASLADPSAEIPLHLADRSLERPGSAGQFPMKPKTAASASKPIYLRSSGFNGARQMEAWLDELGVAHRDPPKLMQLRSLFISDPSPDVAEKWRVICIHNRNEIRKRFRAKLCTEQRDYSQATHREPSPSRHHENDESGSDQNLERLRSQKQLKAIAEWKINRFLEQGPGYIFQVRRGARSSVGAIASAYAGTYYIPCSVHISKQIELLSRHKHKLALLDSLRQRESAESVKASKNLQLQDDIQPASSTAAANVLENFDDVYEEEEDEVNPDDNIQNPMVEVVMKPTNLLDLRVHLSNSQVRQLLANKKEDDPVCRSTFVFSTEAACVNNDKWIGLTGGWKGATIRFLRNAEGFVDSIFVDNLCFEKYYPRQGGTANDPFKCTQCGNVRSHNNTVYAGFRIDNLYRGRYLCAVCNEFTVHVSMSQHLQSVKPRWDPTISRMNDRAQILSEQPFKEFKARRGAGMD